MPGPLLINGRGMPRPYKYTKRAPTLQSKSYSSSSTSNKMRCQ
jgi:hypothetical protein